jgi:hypothetical protein
MANKKNNRHTNNDNNDLSMVNFGPVSTPEMSSARQEPGKSMRDIYSSEAVGESVSNPDVAAYNGGSVVALPPRPPPSAGNTFSDSLPPPPAPIGGAGAGGAGGGIYVSSASSFGYASVEGTPYADGGEVVSSQAQQAQQEQQLRDAYSQSQSSGYSNVPVSLLE